MSEKEFLAKSLNLTYMNTFNKAILNITYTVNSSNFDSENDENQIIPELTSWEIIRWEWYFLELKMNFSSPLYISNDPRYDDQINVKFL